MGLLKNNDEVKLFYQNFSKPNILCATNYVLMTLNKLVM